MIAKRHWTIAERLEFYSMPEPTSGCILWIGNVTTYGYGQFAVRHKDYLAHRAAYEVAFGPIPKGMYVCHKCDVPACINPTHLFLGTPTENAADRNAKNRHARGERIKSSKLTWKQVAAIRTTREKVKAIARKYGVGLTTIYDIKNGVRWREDADA